MVHPPDQPRGKRRASHGAAIAPPVPQGGALDEDDEGFVDGNATAQKRVRTEQSPSLPQEMYIKIMNEPPPLGLRLKKSPSFVDLIQACLAKENSTMDRSAAKNIISKPPLKKATKSGALTISERVKASNFPANFLKIGNWEYKSQYEGDLVAKCYFAKRKLVWEVLNDGLKSKIEVEWLHITALKATCPKEGDGTLELMLSRPPVFFEETDPQPRRHTLWLAAPDFTDGQASICRRHILRCSSSLLRRNFEKLIQSDKRLNELSRQPSIMSDSLFFGTISSIFEIPTVSGGSSSKSAHPVSLCNVSSVFERHGVKHHQPLNLGAAVVDVQAGVVPQEPKNLNLCNQANPELPKEIQDIAPSSKSAHPVSLCNASSVFERGGVKHHQPLNLGAAVLDVQAVLPQKPKNLNLCNQANPELPKEIQEIAPSSKSAHPVSLCNASSVFEKGGVKHHQPLNLGAPVLDVQAEGVPQKPKNLNLCNQTNPELPKEIQEISPSSKSTHPVSLCNASSVFGKGGVKHHQPLNLGAPVLDVQPEVVPQEPKNLNLCNHANPELPKEIQEIADSLLSDTQGPPPSADEKYVLARVDSLNNLLKKDAAPSTLSIPELNDIIVAGEAGYDAFDEELEFHFEDEAIWAPVVRNLGGGTGPPAISRRDSMAYPLENLPRIDSMPQFLFDIAED